MTFLHMIAKFGILEYLSTGLPINFRHARSCYLFTAAQGNRTLDGTKLYCMVTQAHVCKRAQGRCPNAIGWESNPRPVDRKTSTLTASGRVSRYVSRLEMSRDKYLHVSVLSQSRRIHVLSWLESRSSTSRFGSVLVSRLLSHLDYEAMLVYLAVYLFTVDQLILS